MAMIGQSEFRLKTCEGPGTYMAEIHSVRKPGKQAAEGVDPDSAADIVAETIPTKYNRFTILMAEIKTGSDNVLEFRLESLPAAKNQEMKVTRSSDRQSAAMILPHEHRPP